MIEVLTAKARFSENDAIPLFTRVAEKDGVFWYDLTNQNYLKYIATMVVVDGFEPPKPSRCKRDALPAELNDHKI